MRHLSVKKIQLFYCFHVAALLFMSALPILGHFLPIFDGFSFIRTTRNRKLFIQNCDFFVILILLYLSGPILWEATFNFWPILADFYKYTLNTVQAIRNITNFLCTKFTRTRTNSHEFIQISYFVHEFMSEDYVFKEKISGKVSVLPEIF